MSAHRTRILKLDSNEYSAACTCDWVAPIVNQAATARMAADRHTYDATVKAAKMEPTPKPK